MTEAMSHSRKRQARTTRNGKTGGCIDAIGPVTKHMEVFILTHGQFSLVDALVYLSQEIGSCDLSVSTWTAGHRDLGKMADLLASGDFRSVRWLVDRSFITRQPSYCARLRELFGDDVIRTTRAHAKFITMRNDEFDLVVRTSMNLNHNPRMENIEISDDAGFADMVDAEFDHYFRDQQPGIFDAELREKDTASVRTGRAMGQRLYARSVT